MVNMVERKENESDALSQKIQRPRLELGSMLLSFELLDLLIFLIQKTGHLVPTYSSELVFHL